MYPNKKLATSGVIVPQVTCDLPLHPIPINHGWNHLFDLQLADPDFRQPGRIDLLLGVDIFAEVILYGRRSGLSGTPIAFSKYNLDGYWQGALTPVFLHKQ